MKYRIIGNDGEKRNEFPYELQREYISWFFKMKYFKGITIHQSMYDAERAMHEDIKLQKKLPRPGEVLKVYSEEDLIIDKLKGTVA